MPTLYVTCHNCHTEFPTPIGVTDQGLSGVLISGLTHKCPNCGEEAQYFTQDYHVPTATSGRVESGADVAVKNEGDERRAENQVDMVKLAGYGVKPEG
ncbi:MAG: hypothetical protein L3K16_06545 [Thermoplasmata archaeon]|nr:hypothetical protein [Thermoplasmata archaeon]